MLRGKPRNCILSWEAAAGKLQCHRAVTPDLHLFCTEQIGRNASFQPVWRSPYRMSAPKTAAFCLFSLPGGGWSADTKLVSVHWSGRHRVCHTHWFISSAHKDTWTRRIFTEAETWWLTLKFAGNQPKEIKDSCYQQHWYCFKRTIEAWKFRHVKYNHLCITESA